MRHIASIVLIAVLFGCSKESEETVVKASESAALPIAEVGPDLAAPAPLKEAPTLEQVAATAVAEVKEGAEETLASMEERIAVEKARAIELERANNERMAKKLGVSAEEYSNLTIEEQKELIRKHRGRK